MTQLRLLAVDDDSLFLRIVGDQLSPAEFAFEGLREPTRVVPKAVSFAPHLILMDRNMPVLNGAEVIRSLRAFPQTAGIPVAFLTAERSEVEIIRSLRAGAVDVIHKPFEPGYVPRLRALIQEAPQLPRYGGEGPDATQLCEAALRYYARDGRDGTLWVNPGTPFEGRAVFERGRFISGEYGPLTGQAALTEMLQIDNGLWRFEKDPTRVPLRDLAVTPPPVASRYIPRLLVVDDDAELRRLFQAQLTRTGHEVDVAADGLEGFHKAIGNSYDLVVADLSMPRMDGWAMLRALKADHLTREVPVVFLSAHDDLRETLKAARAGAHDYLAKTGRAEPVAKRIHALLTPRYVTVASLEAKERTELDLHVLGAGWVLRTLARLKLSGELQLRDEWGTYRLSVQRGAALRAHSSSSNRETHGLAAIAALLVARGPEGTFVPGAVEGPDEIGLPMDQMIRRTAESLNALEAQLTAQRLADARRFIVDEVLYEVYRKTMPDLAVQVAKAVCEERLRPEEIAQRLQRPKEEILELLKDLLRRKVITFAAA